MLNETKITIKFTKFMRKSFLLPLTLAPLLANAEERKWVTSDALDFFLTYSDGSKKIINFYYTGYHSKARDNKETYDDIVDDIKDGYEDIFNIAPNSTVLDSINVHYNSIEVNYGLTSFSTNSAIRHTETFYYKNGKFYSKTDLLKAQEKSNVKE